MDKSNRLNKNGFTLIEIIVTLSLMAILLASVGGILKVVMDSVYKSHSINSARIISDSICSYLENELTYATKISETSDEDDLAEKAVYVDGGYLLDGSGSHIFSKAFYENMTVDMAVTSNESVLKIHITVGGYSREYTIKNLNAPVGTITMSGYSSATNRIYYNKIEN